MPTSTPVNTQTPNTKKNILVVDDHPVIRDSLHLLLRELSPGTETSLATNLTQMRETLRVRNDYDYAIIDLAIPGARGLDTLKLARELRPELPLIIYSARTEQETILRCLNFGVVGYVPKTQFGDQVVQALRMIFSGQTYIPRQAVSESHQKGYGVRTPERPPTSNPRELGLTERQIEVLTLMLRGLPNKLICRRLNLAEGTVKVHVSNVLRALGVRNRTQAVIAAGELGLQTEF